MAEAAIERQETSPVPRAERTRSARVYRPNVDIIEKADELLLLMDAPGVRAEDVDINYERGELTIYAQADARQGEDTRYLMREYGIGDFCRSFQIGDGVDANNIRAELSDGVLTVHLPKVEQARPRKIKVNG